MHTLRRNLDSLFLPNTTSVVFIRHAESLANLAGAVAGWTDARVTEYGRKQAAALYEGLHLHLPRFNQIYSSDLSRSIETLKYSTLWCWPYKTDERLRELYFGEEEGEHFDSLTDEEKAIYNDINFVARKGEGWLMVRKRVHQFLKENATSPGVYLCYAHGGLMCSLTYEFGLKDMLPNCSAAGFSLDNGVPSQLLFTWKFPELLSQ